MSDMSESMTWDHGRAETSATSVPSPALLTLSLIARVALGLLFLVAGAEKLTALDQFAHNIANYQMLPVSMVNIAALLLVWMEIVVGVLLIAGAAVRGSAFLAGSMLLLFIIAILTAMARGLEIDCGCFASATDTATAAPTEKVGWPKVFEDIGFLAVAVYLIYFPKSYLTIDGLLRREGREEPQERATV